MMVSSFTSSLPKMTPPFATRVMRWYRGIKERGDTMLSVQNLHKSYKVGNEKYEVLKGVSLEVQKGEFVGVMGPSGSGKSTLLNCISCYIPSDSGKSNWVTPILQRSTRRAWLMSETKNSALFFRTFYCWTD